jgi:hypothetical protein
MKITSDIHRDAEAAWVNLQRQMWLKVPSTLQSLKPHVYEVAGALVTMMEKSDALAVNRVLGLGINKPASQKVLDEIIALYDTAGLKRFCLYLSPGARPATVGRILKASGFTLIRNNIKLFRDVKVDVARDRAIDVRRIGRDDAIDFARLVCKHFGWPENRISWLAGMVGVPGFDHFLAFEGDTPIATGMLYANGRVGVLGWAATETKFRRRGAHTALIAARIIRARELGLRWVSVETMEPVKGRPSGSFRNLVQCGFVSDAPTPCLLWQSGATQGDACRRPRAKSHHQRK